LARLADVLGEKSRIYAILSDIHANLPALKSVCADLKDRNAIKAFNLGDLVGYGPFPNEVLESVHDGLKIPISFLKKANIPCRHVCGNHDKWACGAIPFHPKATPRARNSHRWTQDELSGEHKSMLAALKDEIVEDGLCFVHGSPCMPLEYKYIDPMVFISPEIRKEFTTQSWPQWRESGYCRKVLMPAFDEMKRREIRMSFVGHSHRPAVIGLKDDGFIFPSPFDSQKAGKSRNDSFKLEPDCLWIINVGSVGFPRDGDNRACYATFDYDSCVLTLARVAYAVDVTIREYGRKDLKDRKAKEKTRLEQHTIDDLKGILQRGRALKGAFGFSQ